MDLFESVNLETPLAQFLAQMASANELRVSRRDFKLGALASAYISIGIDDNRAFYIGMPDWMIDLMKEFPISSVAFARQIQDQDWLVIITEDASNGRNKDNPIPLRFWFPANPGLFDAFAGIKDRVIKFIPTVIDPKGQPVSLSDTPEPKIEAPLTLQGDWRGVLQIEDEGEVPDVVELDLGNGAEALEGEESLSSLQDEIDRDSGEVTADDISGLDLDALLNNSR